MKMMQCTTPTTALQTWDTKAAKVESSVGGMHTPTMEGEPCD